MRCSAIRTRPDDIAVFHRTEHRAPMISIEREVHAIRYGTEVGISNLYVPGGTATDTRPLVKIFSIKIHVRGRINKHAGTVDANVVATEQRYAGDGIYSRIDDNIVNQ